MGDVHGCGVLSLGDLRLLLTNNTRPASPGRGASASPGRGASASPGRGASSSRAANSSRAGTSRRHRTKDMQETQSGEATKTGRLSPKSARFSGRAVPKGSPLPLRERAQAGKKQVRLSFDASDIDIAANDQSHAGRSESNQLHGQQQPQQEQQQPEQQEDLEPQQLLLHRDMTEEPSSAAVHRNDNDAKEPIETSVAEFGALIENGPTASTTADASPQRPMSSVAEQDPIESPAHWRRQESIDSKKEEDDDWRPRRVASPTISARSLLELPMVEGHLAADDVREDSDPAMDLSSLVVLRPLPYLPATDEDNDEQRSFVYKDQLIAVPFLPLHRLEGWGRETAPSHGSQWTSALKNKVVGRTTIKK